MNKLETCDSAGTHGKRATYPKTSNGGMLKRNIHYQLNIEPTFLPIEND